MHPTIRCHVLGDAKVGKTALTIQYCAHRFVGELDPVVFENYKNYVMVDNKPVSVEILDPAGAEAHPALREQWIRASSCFIYMYSITSSQSFDSIASYLKFVKKVLDEQRTPCMLVGNKCDLAKTRQVEKSDGQELAAAIQCPFYEVSAKDKINVNELFSELVRQHRLHYEEENNRKRK